MIRTAATLDPAAKAPTDERVPTQESLGPQADASTPPPAAAKAMADKPDAATPPSPAAAAAELAAALALPTVAETLPLPDTDVVVDYDWSVPRRFIPAERQRLQDFAAAAAKLASSELTGFLRLELTLEAGSVTEYYGADAWNPRSMPAYPVPLTDAESRACGMLAIPPGLALGWIERLLGGKAPANAPMRKLTALEAALLLDIAAVLTKALAAASHNAGLPTEALAKAGGPALQHVERVAVDESPLAGHESDECCRFTLATAAGPNRLEIAVILASDFLTAIANPEAVNQKPRPAAEVRKDILRHLASITASATAKLGTATVTMRDIAAMEADDILLLDRLVGDPVELLVNGSVAHRGLPVTCEGAYAFQVINQRQWPRLITSGKDDQA